VRPTGLDITVHSSHGKRSAGHLSRQGSPLLRWALFEAAQCAARPGSPDHAYYRRVADRVGGNRAALSVARKMVRRAHHTLRVGPRLVSGPPCTRCSMGRAHRAAAPG
jgi:transposase